VGAIAYATRTSRRTPELSTIELAMEPAE
jgi:hypothetical protein